MFAFVIQVSVTPSHISWCKRCKDCSIPSIWRQKEQSPTDAMLVRYLPSSSVHPSVTSRCSTKMAKPRITQTMPYDSPDSFLTPTVVGRRCLIPPKFVPYVTHPL